MRVLEAPPRERGVHSKLTSVWRGESSAFETLLNVAGLQKQQCFIFFQVVAANNLAGTVQQDGASEPLWRTLPSLSDFDSLDTTPEEITSAGEQHDLSVPAMPFQMSCLSANGRPDDVLRNGDEVILREAK